MIKHATTVAELLLQGKALHQHIIWMRIFPKEGQGTLRLEP